MAELAELVNEEIRTRAHWYKVQPHSGNPKTPEERVAARAMWKAQEALCKELGVTRFGEAKKIAGYTPARRRHNGSKADEIE